MYKLLYGRDLLQVQIQVFLELCAWVAACSGGDTGAFSHGCGERFSCCSKRSPRKWRPARCEPREESPEVFWRHKQGALQKALRSDVEDTYRICGLRSIGGDQCRKDCIPYGALLWVRYIRLRPIEADPRDLCTRNCRQDRYL